MFSKKLKTLPQPLQKYFASQDIHTKERFIEFCESQKDAAFYQLFFLSQTNVKQFPLNGIIEESIIFAAVDQYRFFDATLELAR